MLSTSGDTHLGGDDFDKVCIVLEQIWFHLFYCSIGDVLFNFNLIYSCRE